MKPDIDSIVKDLLAQNPDLEIEAGVLRVLVADMLAQQPTVNVDPAFRARLRAELTRRAPAAKEKRLALPWWLVYTVPFGVAAILLLVVQPPQKVLPPTAPIPTNTNIDSTASEVAPVMMPVDMGASKRGGGPIDDAAATSAGFAEDARMYQVPVGTNDSFIAVFTPDRKAIQFTDISVSAPAFVHITSERGGSLTSNLIMPGEHTNLFLPISWTAARGETYTAALYYDNGDGVFVPADDMTAYDVAGMPITVSLVAQ